MQVRFHGKLTRGWVLGPTDDLPPRVLKVHKVVSPVRFFDERLLELFRWMSERYIAPLATVIGRSFPPRVASEEHSVRGGGGGADAPLASPFPTPLRIDPPAFGPASAAVRVDRAFYRNGSALFDAIRSSGAGLFRVRPAPEHEQLLAVDAVQACLDAGRRAIVIVGEAEPLPATAAHLAETFGDRVALFVGGDKRERYRTWLEIQAGRYDVVVGTRPAVFAPLGSLGLIWLSRESHALHREERSPYFHVRDVAAKRAEIEDAVFVMSALCHSSEAAVMPATDVEPATRAWPPVEVVKPGPEGRAPRLVAALKESSRAFLFEPLRGYGVARVCKSCGRPAACAECGGALRVEQGRIRCVVCEAPGRCAECGSTHFGIARGGAERVEEWLGRLVDVPVRRDDHPEPRAGVTVGGAESVKEIDPPGLDLVGILDADLAARRPGLSALEHALAVWMEAAGWARPNGRVIVQTRAPSDAALQSLVQGAPARHHRAERRRREAAGFPPGFPVFRMFGGRDLRKRLDETAPHHVLETSLGDETVCLLTIRPDALPEFGRTVRALAERGVVTRVEAEPHL